MIFGGGMHQKCMKTISKNKLLNYIEHEQIAFQFGDGLLSITNPEENYSDDDFGKSIADDFDKMKEFIIKSNSITAVHKEDVVSKDDKLGFNEFANWATAKDLLILVDEYLLLCLPNLDTRNVVFEMHNMTD